MEIVQIGAVTDDAASDIQYMGYEIHPIVKDDVDDKTPDDTDEDDDETPDTDTTDDNDDEKVNGDEATGDDEEGNEDENDDENDDENENSIDLGRDVVERIVFYRDTNTGDIYVRAEIINRFNLTPTREGTDIGGFTGYRIDREDARYIENNQNNSYSPYIVEYKDITLKNEYETNNRVVEKIILYKDVDNDNNIYVRKSVINRFTLDYIGDARDVEGIPGYRISDEDAEYIENNQNNSYSPYVVEYKDVHLGKDKEEDYEWEN